MTHAKRSAFRPLFAAALLVAAMLPSVPVRAQPFGVGTYGADVPFGSLTSLSIELSDSVGMLLAPTGSNFYGTGQHTITVTSLDVVGYDLYINSDATPDMVNGGDSIPASTNVAAAPLALNSWGYNTDGSSDFIGITVSPVLLKGASGPYKNGDDTVITYGALIDITKQSGTYTSDVVYTALGRT